MTAVILILVLALLAALLCLRGRTGHPGLRELQGWAYAHRGLHGNGVPENSMEAFRKALEQGYGVELDIHRMRDGKLAVIHDASLKRTAGADITIEELSQEELARYPLEGTQERIPLFSQVLELFDGKAPLIIELKPEKGNHAALAEEACRMMEGYSGPWCMESFDPRCILWLRRHRPQVIRGQLAYNYFKKENSLPWILKFLLTNNLLNVATRPDFVAYKFVHRKNISNFLCRKLWRIQGVAWTLRSPQEHSDALEEGWLPIFENYIP